MFDTKSCKVSSLYFQFFVPKIITSQNKLKLMLSLFKIYLKFIFMLLTY